MKESQLGGLVHLIKFCRLPGESQSNVSPEKQQQTNRKKTQLKTTSWSRMHEWQLRSVWENGLWKCDFPNAFTLCCPQVCVQSARNSSTASLRYKNPVTLRIPNSTSWARRLVVGSDSGSVSLGVLQKLLGGTTGQRLSVQIAQAAAGLLTMVAAAGGCCSAGSVIRPGCCAEWRLGALTGRRSMAGQCWNSTSHFCHPVLYCSVLLLNCTRLLMVFCWSRDVWYLCTCDPFYSLEWCTQNVAFLLDFWQKL